MSTIDRPIGARLEGTGCRFTVWAPNAELVRVLIQSGVAWQPGGVDRVGELQRGEDGYWSGLLAGVRAGDLYRYEVTHGGRPCLRIDPAARDVIHSALTCAPGAAGGNASIVVDPSFAWSEFRTPAFENFIVYELHVGSFAGRGDEFEGPVARFDAIQAKLGYIRELGFSAIQLLPVQEFALDRSWGYNPASYFSPESAYGHPEDLRRLVDAAHRAGLAVLFDVVYNHTGPGDNSLWEFDGETRGGGIYFEGGRATSWGPGPAWWKREVRHFFAENARMYFREYRADGLRFDVTTQIDGQHLRLAIAELQEEFPDKYFVAEHLPADPWVTTDGGFDATWLARSHHEIQRALAGDRPLERVRSVLGWDGYRHPWNLVKYPLGSHDDIGDQENGDAEHGTGDWAKRHRYFVDLFGGRHDALARAKCRVAWALAGLMPGTPQLFMGSECHMGAPEVAWGYWHDGADARGDHRFDWSIAGDGIGWPMRRLVRAVNELRWRHPSLRGETLHITHWDEANQVLGFKRWTDSDCVLVAVNLGGRGFSDHSYGLGTGGQRGRWTQVLCTQDATFGGRDGAGNAYWEPWTQHDGRIWINLPEWSVLAFRLA